MQPLPSGSCIHCGAAKIAGPECPRCGVIYVKAELHRSRVPPAPKELLSAAEPPASASAWEGDAEDERLEALLRLLAIPLALVLARVAIASSVLHAVLRVFFSMWVHELGHAAMAWL